MSAIFEKWTDLSTAQGSGASRFCRFHPVSTGCPFSGSIRACPACTVFGREEDSRQRARRTKVSTNPSIVWILDSAVGLRPRACNALLVSGPMLSV